MAIGKLTKLGGNLESPRDSKPSDYPAVGPTGSAGMASGSNQLLKQTVNQEGPQHTQDGGPGTGAIWGKADWTVGKNTGEGGPAGDVKCDWGVDLKTGQITPDIVKYPA